MVKILNNTSSEQKLNHRLLRGFCDDVNTTLISSVEILFKFIRVSTDGVFLF
jgi:hypothetical protein